MPAGEQRRVARRNERLEWLQSLAWTEHQLRAFQRADRLRYYGAAHQAEMLVAQECPLSIIVMLMVRWSISSGAHGALRVAVAWQLC